MADDSVSKDSSHDSSQTNQTEEVDDPKSPLPLPPTEESPLTSSKFYSKRIELKPGGMAWWRERCIQLESEKKVLEEKVNEHEQNSWAWQVNPVIYG